MTSSKAGKFLTRALAVAALLGVYFIGAASLSGLLLSATTTSAQARGWRRGWRGGRGWRRGWRWHGPHYRGGCWRWTPVGRVWVCG